MASEGTVVDMETWPPVTNSTPKLCNTNHIFVFLYSVTQNKVCVLFTSVCSNKKYVLSFF